MVERKKIIKRIRENEGKSGGKMECMGKDLI